MKTPKIVFSGHQWNRSRIVMVLVGVVSLLSVAQSAGTHSVQAASASTQIHTLGSCWGPCTG